MLSAAGLGPDDLGCPPALPQHEPTKAAWLVDGRTPDRLAMNCSGKHAAMLSACVAAGWPTESYLERDHPLQQAIESRLGEAAGEKVSAVVVDGCGAPQHALSLTGLARGVLSLVDAPEGSRDRSVADAMRAHPWLVAGTGREDTDLMSAVPGLLTKVGADGVHVAALPGCRCGGLQARRRRRPGPDADARRGAAAARGVRRGACTVVADTRHRWGGCGGRGPPRDRRKRLTCVFWCDGVHVDLLAAPLATASTPG